MAVRSLRYGFREHQEDMNYLVANLKADPRAAELATAVEVSADSLRTQSENWDNQRHLVVETQVALRIVTESLHNAVRNARDAILKDVRHRRDSAKFLTYFPRGLAVLFKRPYAEQLRAVRSLAERCGQDPSPAVQGQASDLQAAAEEMHAAYERRDDALVAETTAYGQLQIQKLESIDTCRRTAHRLAELYPREGERVRSYFRLVEHRTRPRTMAAGKPALVAASDTVPGASPGIEEAAAPAAAAPALSLISANVA